MKHISQYRNPFAVAFFIPYILKSVFSGILQLFYTVIVFTTLIIL